MLDGDNLSGARAGGGEYWMIHRGPAFLAVVLFGSSPTPPPLSR
jgi:hypothetical protein